MVEVKDFSAEKNIPGTLDNEFDVVLRKFDLISLIHPLLFAVVLAILALLGGRGRWLFSAILFAFYLLDWLLLALLPARGKSFGPPQPVTLILAVMRTIFALLPVEAALPLQIVGTGLVFYGFWVEPHRIKVTQQRYETAKLGKGTRFSVLHLGDYHLERITERERQLDEIIQTTKPDLILFSGDVLNLSFTEDPIAIKQAREMISNWQAPLGSFVVSGSEAVDLHHVFPELMRGLPVQHLQNDNIAIAVGNDTIRLSGLSCSHRPWLDSPKLETLAHENGGAFSILLYHSPDLAPNASKLGYDLQLSGHTHGGQVCFPFIGPLFTASLYGRAFSSGLYRLNGLKLYITRGIGMEGMAAPRVRFLCPPEVILWEIAGTGQEPEQEEK